jgi:hypothetical protein
MKPLNSGTVIECDGCHDQHAIAFNKEDYEAWQAGELIQNAMPYVIMDDRELMISHLCPSCFNDLFGEEE